MLPAARPQKHAPLPAVFADSLVLPQVFSHSVIQEVFICTVYVEVVCTPCVLTPMPCLLLACTAVTVVPAAAYDMAVMALMADPEITEDLFSVMSAGECEGCARGGTGLGWYGAEGNHYQAASPAGIHLRRSACSALVHYARIYACRSHLKTVVCVLPAVCAGEAGARNIPALAWSLVSTPSNAERLDGFAFQKLSKQRCVCQRPHVCRTAAQHMQFICGSNCMMVGRHFAICLC
jgi:hypothetical protein